MAISHFGSAGLLAPSAEGRYGLTANIKKVDQRSIGADTVVTGWTDYVLVDRLLAKDAFRATMAVPYTAQFFDHLMVTERQRAATEGAVRASISKLINDLFVFNVGVAQNPPKVARPAITKSNEEKLRELKRLNDAGLISKEVYVDQQKIILNMP